MADKEIDAGTTPSIRDSISTAVETVIADSPNATPEVKAEVEAARVARTRDDAGRFVHEAAAAREKSEASLKSPQTSDKTISASPVRPSSWKKDYWGHWDKLAAGQATTPEEAMALAAYIAQREQDYAKGVSTYKAEWDNARPFLEAMQPILPMLEQGGIDPGRWLQDMSRAHISLARGGPREKLQTLFQIAEAFQVPLEEIFDQDEHGRLYLNPQKLQGVSSQNRPAPRPQQDVREMVREIMVEQEAAQQVSGFTKQHPHLEQVRDTMAGLLRAGLVEDLNSAYEAALRMPRHKDLFDSIQANSHEGNEASQRDAAAKAAQAARVKAVSPRSSTPVGSMKTAKDTGLRSVIEDAFNARGGRV